MPTPMRYWHRPRLAAGLAVLALTTAVSGCGGTAASSTSGSAADAGAKGTSATATSAQAPGGLAALEAAAKKEGTLNVIALPPDWANYGEIIKAFQTKYGIKVASANPDGSSQDEINAVKTLKGQDRAPDVLDLGSAFALSAAADGLLAPYRVATWNDIPQASKDAGALWYYDYGGYISIGYDAAKVSPAPAAFADLANPAYKGQVALNGDPTKAGAAFGGVYAAALANGGSFDDIKPGVDFFGRLKKADTFIPVQASPATIENGQTPIVIDWDYLQASVAAKLAGKVDWKIVVPRDGKYASYYAQAISKTAPHPAAARLWEEFLYSDEGQNLWLKGMARPVRLAAMQKAGTADAGALAKLPPVEGEPSFPTTDQTDKAKAYLAQNWAKAVG